MSFKRSMKEADVMRIVIAPLELVYTPQQRQHLPDGNENPAYGALVKLYVETLCPFTLEALEAGMRAFLTEWQYHRWPKPGELRRFMIEAERELIDGRALPKPELAKTPSAPAISDAERQRMRRKVAAMLHLLKTRGFDRIDEAEARAWCHAAVDDPRWDSRLAS